MLLFSSLIASMSLENTTEWDTQLGRYWQTVSNLGLFPVLMIGAVLLITGIVFSFWGVFSKSDIFVVISTIQLYQIRRDGLKGGVLSISG